MWQMDGKGGKNGELSLVVQMIDNGDAGIDSRNCEKRSNVAHWPLRKGQNFEKKISSSLHIQYLSRLQVYEFFILTLPFGV